MTISCRVATGIGVEVGSEVAVVIGVFVKVGVTITAISATVGDATSVDVGAMGVGKGVGIANVGATANTVGDAIARVGGLSGVDVDTELVTRVGIAGGSGARVTCTFDLVGIPKVGATAFVSVGCRTTGG